MTVHKSNSYTICRWLCYEYISNLVFKRCMMSKMSSSGESEQTSARSAVRSRVRIRKIRKSTKSEKPSHAAAKMSDSKNTLLDSYSKMFDSIKSKSTDQMKADVLDAIKKIEKTEAVVKVESLLKSFQELVVKETAKLADKVKKIK